MASAVGTQSAPPAKEAESILNPTSQGSSRPDVTMAEAETETNNTPTALSSGGRDEAHPKQSLQHLLTSDPTISSQPRSQSQTTSTKSPQQETPTKHPLVWVEGPAGAEAAEADASTQNDSYTRAAEFNPSHTMTVAHTRRNANGTIGSVYSGNKIRHLKKDDGVPLWRKDIQLKFLRCVFEDDTKVFTKAFDGTKGHTFADIYVDAMARSSKTSKVLKEKLLADRQGAMTMAMICLLVNVGRMNTTLNFFPEMRAQLRTYHAIPSLQAHQDPNAYKQLQDAPRLKSILKGASEDVNQPSTIDKIKQAAIPRTNPVNLIFVLSQYAPKISETHFFPPRDFFDLVMRATLSSKSRANNFLWLIWWYLESDFSENDALNNPFGAGLHGDETEGLPIKVPAFEHLTDEQADVENVDTQEEKDYGEMKKDERRRILEEDETVGPPLKKAKKTNGEAALVAPSDTDPTRSPSPSSAIQPRASIDFSRDSMSAAAANGVVPESSPATTRYQPLQSKASPHPLALQTTISPHFPGSSPIAAPPASGSHPILSAGFSGTSNGAYRRQRPETSHQKAVNKNRRMRTDHILHKQMVGAQKAARRDKRRTSSSYGMLAYERVMEVPDMYDTEDERSWGPAGLVPNHGREGEDYGEESIRHKKVVDRALRRLGREGSGGGVSGHGMMRGLFPKRKRKEREYLDEDGDGGRERKRRKEGNDGQDTPVRERNGDGQPRQEGLDDLDLDLLGEGRSGSEDESGMEGSEGDETEEDNMNEG